MLTAIIPKLPMRDINTTKDFYLTQLGFQALSDYEDYLILEKDQIQIHFFAFKALDPKENDGQVYIRTDAIEELYQSLLGKRSIIHPNGQLQLKPWGQREFSVLDPDNNLLTFGQSERA
ncbi:MAG: VOC family protein [Spirosomataceae bacterium]